MAAEKRLQVISPPCPIRSKAVTDKRALTFRKKLKINGLRVTDFSDRLDRAIQRGERIKSRRDEESSAETLSSEEAKSRHSAAKIELSEHVEECLKALVDRFPGFEHAPVYSEDGWGGHIKRLDLALGKPGGAKEEFSRLELLVKPLSDLPILSVAGKATVRDKDLFSRTHYQRLNELDLDSFRESVDLWILEYAERYSSTS